MFSTALLEDGCRLLNLLRLDQEGLLEEEEEEDGPASSAWTEEVAVNWVRAALVVHGNRNAGDGREIVRRVWESPY